MQLDLLAGETGRLARSARRLDLRGAEDLQLEQRRPRVARSADIFRVLKRVLAARAAQRVIGGARRRAHVVSAAKPVTKKSARDAGLAMLLRRERIDARGVRANPSLDPLRVGR